MDKTEQPKDFVIWAEKQAAALKARQFTKLDYDNLIEEIEDMSKSEKRSLESYLERLIEHILKLKYWKSEYDTDSTSCRGLLGRRVLHNYRHWQAEITNFRNRINRLIKRSPSLNNYLEEIFLDIYQEAIEAKSKEFDIPEHKPISLSKILDKNFFPEIKWES